MTFHKYPDTVTLAKRPEILSVKQVVATEKLHGTNFRVFFLAGMATNVRQRHPEGCPLSQRHKGAHSRTS